MKYLSGIGLLTLTLAIAVAGCTKRQSGVSVSSNTTSAGGDVASSAKPRIGYVTNGVARFWVIADAGAKQGGEEANANVEVLMPAEGISDQKRMIEDLLTKGVDGIAVSPIDPENQTELLNKAAKYTKLITHDSDAPDAHSAAASDQPCASRAWIVCKSAKGDPDSDLDRRRQPFQLSLGSGSDPHSVCGWHVTPASARDLAPPRPAPTGWHWPSRSDR